MKPTEISGNLIGLTHLNSFRCPGVSPVHTHAKSWGRKDGGGFRSKELECYPSGFCRVLAECIIDTLLEYDRHMSGPTGPLTDMSAIKKATTSWSIPSSEEGPGIAILNESSGQGKRHFIDPSLSAIYVHVDDHIILGHSSARTDFFAGTSCSKP